MYWKINFNYSCKCLSCCAELIKNKIEIIKKNEYSIIIKTDRSYMNILDICIGYDVVNIKPYFIRNWREKWETMKNKQK